jgi:predicted metal-dependent hydrolase
VTYEIVRSPRARRTRLSVGPEHRVRVVVPKRTRIADVAQLLEPHSGWILRQLDRLASVESRTVRVAHGQSLPYKGKLLLLQASVAARDVVRFDGDALWVEFRAQTPLIDVVESWYRERARESIREKVAEWSGGMGVRPGKISIRDQRTRWGSCSSHAGLSFNWRLVMAPSDVMEYVVIHELAHIAVPNHGKEFWAVLQGHCPRYLEHKRWLREHGPELSMKSSCP